MFGLALAAVLSLTFVQAAPAAVYQWQENGCLIDSWNRALGAWQFANETSMSQTMCQDACLLRNYVYAGLEAGTQCFCANSVTYGDWSSGAGVAASDCAIPCAGNATQQCGGGFRLWTYKYAVTVASSSTSAKSSTSASTSVASQSKITTASSTGSASKSTASSASTSSQSTSSTKPSSSSVSPASSASLNKTTSISASASSSSTQTRSSSSLTVSSSSTSKSSSTALTSKISTSSSVQVKSSVSSSAATMTSTSSGKTSGLLSSTASPSVSTKSSSTAVTSKISASSSAQVKSSVSSITTTKTSTSSSAVSSATSSVSTASKVTASKKAGLGWTSDSGSRWSDFTAINGSKISWTYDWNSVVVPGTPLDALEFVPMAWGGGSAGGFATDSASFPSLEVSNVLSFNEPDQSWDVGGSSMTPAQGATAHQAIFNETVSTLYRIGTPAVARGSKWWLEQWVTACNGSCAYDFVPLHFYGIDAGDMITYIKDFITTFGKPVWVTEYACMDFGGATVVCTLEEAMAFQAEVIQYMESEPMVERYAAFGTFTSWAAGGNANGMMNSDGSANQLGQFYATA